MKKIFLLILPILAICSCNDDDEQLATVRTNDARVTYSADPLEKKAEALIGGIVISDGGVGVSERGLLFGENPNPSGKIVTGSGLGEFTTTVQLDDKKKVYYYRAYAVSDRGTVYGDLKMIGAKLDKPMFPENFDGETFPPPGWTIIDHDGDGLNWMPSNSSRLPIGAISDSENEIAPYNLLITPKFEVTGSNPVFSWEAGSIASPTGTYFDEHYKVVVSTLGNSFEDFDESKPGVVNMHEETMTAEFARTYVYKEIPLDQFAGQQIYIAFIHYNCSDEYAMVIKNVDFSGASAGSIVTPPAIAGYYRTGSPKNKDVESFKSGLVLAGGGTDNDAAMKWFLQRANGGDVVVLRASGGDGYNPYFYARLGIPVNSVTTMVLDTEEKADMTEVAEIIKSAEALFIAGGDQWNYVNYWAGTRTADAIDYLINTKNVVVGGTSAGMAVLSEVVFTAENGTPTSEEALTDPYNSQIKLDDDVFAVPNIVASVVTDMHYSNRSRHGRHVAFMARMATDWGMTARGIGCDENTAVCIDLDDKKATVYGPCAYFIQQNGSAPEVCISGQPLTWNNGGQALKVYKLPGNNDGSSTFNLDDSDWTAGSGGTWQWWSVNNGTLTETNM